MPPAKKPPAKGAAPLRRLPSGKGKGFGVKAGVATAATAPLLLADDDEESEAEEEEETEEAQMIWSILFSCFPLIWTIATEFAAEAFEAVRAAYGQSNRRLPAQHLFQP